MTDVTAIPGAAALMGKGVYRGVPRHLPQTARNHHAVVAGPPPACVAAARQLGEAGWKVTIVTRGRCDGQGVARNCRRRSYTDVACATGVEGLEAVVLRRIDTGRVDAVNASALFLV
jgi:hypothetical protein